jgi:hypothetical protein
MPLLDYNSMVVNHFINDHQINFIIYIGRCFVKHKLIYALNHGPCTCSNVPIMKRVARHLDKMKHIIQAFMYGFVKPKNVIIAKPNRPILFFPN